MKKRTSYPLVTLLLLLLVASLRACGRLPDDRQTADPSATSRPPAAPGDMAPGPSDAAPTQLTGRVVHVADGDSFTLRTDGKEIRVRMYGIDAPELGQPYSQRARSALSEKILDRTVTLEIVDTDSFGRIVGRVHVQGAEINGLMVQQGFAWSYKWHDEFPAREDEARRARRGLWQDADPQPPWDYRRQNPRR